MPIRLWAGLIALLTLAAPAAAQNYPIRPVTFVVPFPPGGPISVVGRLPGYEAALRYGLLAPRGTSPAAIARLNQELRTAPAAPDVLMKLGNDGVDALPSTPAQYAADIDREEKTWSQIVTALGLKGE